MKKEIIEQNNELKHRRKGGAFDDFARILRKINKIFFGTGVVIENRIGKERPQDVVNQASFVKSKNVFEIYQTNSPEKGTYNLIKIGRKGTGEFTNTNSIELIANAKSGEQKSANGQIVLKIHKDGVEQNGSIAIIDLSTSILNGNGVVSYASGSGDGFAYIGYQDTNGGIPIYVAVDKDGISMQGLPTSAPSSPGYLWNSGGFIKIT